MSVTTHKNRMDTSELSEKYRVVNRIKANKAHANSVHHGKMAIITPMVVATPLPPLNFKNTGQL